MINAKTLQSKLTVENIVAIIEYLGGELKHQDGKNLIFTSICCKCNASAHKPKLYYYIESQHFFCFKCSESFNIFNLIIHIKKCTFPQSLEYVCDICNIDKQDVERKTKKRTENTWEKRLNRYIRARNGDTILQTYNDSVLDFFEEKYHQSWIDEGISIESMQRYGIRWYPYHCSIIIPCYNENNELIGIRERFLRPDDIDNYGKYRPLIMACGQQYNFPTNSAFYGISNNIKAIIKKKEVWLVEGEKSVLKFDTWFGKDNVSLAMYGSNLGKYRRDYLLSLGIKKVVIMLDSDFHRIGSEDYNKFEKKVFKISNMFKGIVDVEVCYNNQEYNGYKKCACDFTREQFDVLWKKRERV